MPNEESKSSVGQQLKRRRQRQGLALSDIELATKIRGKYLVALESGDYSSLPNDIYSRGFVQHYADYLGLDGAQLAAEYVKERGGITEASTVAPKMVQPRRMVVTVRLAVMAVAIIIIGSLILYLGFELSALAAPPSVSISSPASDVIVTSPTLTVAGHVTPGADVLVDDVPVITSGSGAFSTSIVIQNGINAIRITATSKLNKVTTVTRNILAKLPQDKSVASGVPAATFSGVAVSVKVENSATSIAVTVDGQQKFKGIFLPGEQMVFQGTSDIQLTTSDAGNTSVAVTNQNVADKVLSPLGSAGEVRTNQDFGATSNFP